MFYSISLLQKNLTFFELEVGVGVGVEVEVEVGDLNDLFWYSGGWIFFSFFRPYEWLDN